MKKHAFTLIELLIVVAIIAILAAIAVPNFLEAQTRSKVARVKADMRAVATALEAYNVDTNHYPHPLMGVIAQRDNLFPPNNAALAAYVEFVFELTTPVAYLTSVGFSDPFMPNATSIKAYTGTWVLPPFYKSTCQYSSMNGYWASQVVGNYPGSSLFPGFCVSSYGPDRGPDGIEHMAYEAITPNRTPNYNRLYDPTNGTVSRGDIARFGGGVKFSSMGGGGN